MKKPVDVDEYIADFPEDVQLLMQQLRATIKLAAPDAEEIISYGMPGFKSNGKLVWFAAYKKHIGFYPIYGKEALEAELYPYRGKGTKDSLHFPLNKPLPLDLIVKIVKYKAAANLK